MKLGDSITYSQATPVQPDAPQQPKNGTLYQGEIVDLGDLCVGVRKDGWWGESELYIVCKSDIVSTLHPDEPSTAMPLEGSVVGKKSDSTQGRNIYE